MTDEMTLAQTADTGTDTRLLHIVPHNQWPVALCGFEVKEYLATTKGMDRCAECQRLSVGRNFGPSTPPPGIEPK